jgi:hypothetical protein
VRRAALTCATVACVGIGPAVAAPAVDEATRAPLEQRLRLVATLMSDGPTQQRVQASGQPRAQAHLDEGRVHHALAQDLLARGDLAGARREADEALRHLGLARRLAPDAPTRQAAARSRYDQQLATLERLLDAWHQRGGAAVALDGDQVMAQALIHTARQFAQEQRYEEAGYTLANAESHVLSGMNSLLQARTLDYTARASTPAEEFQLELLRHAALADLVPLAINDLKPKPEALALVERYAEASQTLRSQAQAHRTAGDLNQALTHLRNALLYVQRALATAGLVAPADSGLATGDRR